MSPPAALVPAAVLRLAAEPATLTSMPRTLAEPVAMFAYGGGGAAGAGCGRVHLPPGRAHRRRLTRQSRVWTAAGRLRSRAAVVKPSPPVVEKAPRCAKITVIPAFTGMTDKTAPPLVVTAPPRGCPTGRDLSLRRTISKVGQGFYQQPLTREVGWLFP